MASRSKALQSQGGPGRGCLWIFGGIFVAVGCGVFWGLSVVPLMRLVDAQSWDEVSCIIDTSYVETHDGDDGDTYSASIHYSYAYGNGDYEGARYIFAEVSTGSHKRQQDIVDRYPAGSTSKCYVNPDAPDESVLKRNLTPGYFFGFMGLLFVGAGCLVIFFGSFHGGSSGAKSSSARRIDSSHSTSSTGRVTLEPESGPIGRFIGITIFALIWNGITGAVCYGILSDGDVGIIPYLFMTPFVLVGVLLISAVFYNFLAMFNPRVRLTVDRGAACLGSDVELEWSIVGSSSRINSFRIKLEGHEEARYTRGTDTYTDEHTFMTIDLLNTSERREIGHGRVTVSIPEFSMHSFDGGNNKIIWEFSVEGEINRWPDMGNTFEYTVLPLDVSEKR
jgi:hypothetical protein